MVLLKGKSAKPVEVWTGSTNMSVGGFHGQANVGHWVRDGEVAQAFAEYWELLSKDPGAKKGDDDATVRAKNKKFRDAVEALGQVPTALAQIPNGITTIFSPRTGTHVLEMYAALVDEAEDLSCITLAFGIGEVFKALLSDNTNHSHLAFFLLEKEDKPNKRSKKKFVALNSRNNVYKAWGSFLRQPLHQWAKETSAGILGLNSHVSFIHSKFLLRDPLGADPIVVTGSANFSPPSTKENDENMLIIRGDKRVADIYFTEFNRLFFHYYFRSVQEATLKRRNGPPPGTESLFLREDDDWLDKYKRGSLRRKRVEVFTRMKGFAS
jgi:phosphatidylserine/phosphatidylglycerophosphate/cardiolipin synthase-like enzyme